jgi:ABC-type iron transport system FetAB ATPase subunit
MADGGSSGWPAGSPPHAHAVSLGLDKGQDQEATGPSGTGPLVLETPVCMSGARWRGNIRWVDFSVEDGAAISTKF